MAEPTLEAALLAVQQAAPSLPKDGSAQYGRYTTLGTLLRIMRPILNENELVISQAPTTGADGTAALRTTIIHAPTGKSITDLMPLPLTDGRPHTVGGALTYTRRYMLTGMLGLDSDDDDDGGAAQAAAPATTRRRRTPDTAQTPDNNGAGSGHANRPF